MENTFCTNCGSKIPNRARFCAACGERLVEEHERPAFCIHCGAPLAQDAAFCISCGSSVTKPSEGNQYSELGQLRSDVELLHEELEILEDSYIESSENSTTKVVGIVVGILLIAVLAAGAWSLASDGNDSNSQKMTSKALDEMYPVSYEIKPTATPDPLDAFMSEEWVKAQTHISAGEYDLAIEVLQKIFERNQYPQLLFAGLGMAADSYRVIGSYELAIEYYDKASAAGEEQGLSDVEAQLGKAISKMRWVESGTYSGDTLKFLVDTGDSGYSSAMDDLNYVINSEGTSNDDKSMAYASRAELWTLLRKLYPSSFSDADAKAVDDLIKAEELSIDGLIFYYDYEHRD